MNSHSGYQGNNQGYRSGTNYNSTSYGSRSGGQWADSKDNSYPSHSGKDQSTWSRPPKKYNNGDEICESGADLNCLDGAAELNDYKAQLVLKRMVRCNTLTIGAQKSPEYYVKLIRYHFIKSDEPLLSLQALGSSCQNLIYTSCLLTMKGYAKYKRIKNDHLSVPIADSKTGDHIGLIKKVRLTVKLIKSENFLQLVEQEEKRTNMRLARDSTTNKQRSQPYH